MKIHIVLLLVLLPIVSYSQNADSVNHLWLGFGFSQVWAIKGAIQYQFKIDPLRMMIGIGGGHEYHREGLLLPPPPYYSGSTLGDFLNAQVQVGILQLPLYAGMGFGIEQHQQHVYPEGAESFGHTDYQVTKTSGGWTAMIGYYTYPGLGLKIDYSQYRKFGWEFLVGIRL